MTDEEAFFGIWWALYRTKRWRKIRPDMGPEPSPGYLAGLEETAKLGWMARASLHVTPNREFVKPADEPLDEREDPCHPDFIGPIEPSDAQFKNFHRLLCERFNYTHDEKDWKRDQLSLIEWIAARHTVEQNVVLNSKELDYARELAKTRAILAETLEYARQTMPAERYQFARVMCRGAAPETNDGLWTSPVKLALLDIAHHAYHVLDDIAEHERSPDHEKICEALDRLEPESTDPHEMIFALRAAVSGDLS